MESQPQNPGFRNSPGNLHYEKKMMNNLALFQESDKEEQPGDRRSRTSLRSSKKSWLLW